MPPLRRPTFDTPAKETAAPDAPPPPPPPRRRPVHPLTGGTLAAALRVAAETGAAPPAPLAVLAPDVFAMDALAAASATVAAGPGAPPHARLTVADFRAGLLAAGAEPARATPEWVANSLRWLVWKMAALERAHPASLAGAACVASVVADGLAWRYEGEVGRGRRPHVAKLLEQDVGAGTPCILRVARVINDTTLEVTDGWYGVPATVDAPFAAALARGAIHAGTKLYVVGARLVAPGPDTPLAALAAGARVELAWNCVAPAPTDARLGRTRARARACVHYPASPPTVAPCPSPRLW